MSDASPLLRTCRGDDGGPGYLRRVALPRLVSLLVVALVAATTLVVAPSSPAPATAAGPAVFLLGDSVMAGLDYGDEIDSLAGRYSVTLDAAVCRRLASASCSYQGSAPTNAMQVLAANAGQLGQAVVMMAGYNDAPLGPAAEVVMDELDRQGVPVVLWLTYESPGGRFDDANAQLRAVAAGHPRVVVADWAAHSAGQSSWFAADGLHLAGPGRAALTSYIGAQLDATVGGIPSACGVQPALSPPGAPGAQPASGPGRYTAIDPVRILDTRAGVGVDEPGRRAAFAVVPLDVAAAARPPDAIGVVLTVTVTEPCQPGYVTAYPCSSGAPTASNLNYDAGETVPNLVVVALDPVGAACLLTSAETHLVADVAGWVGVDGDGFMAESPHRVADTRDGTGGRDIPLPAGVTVAIPLAVAPGTTAAVVNVTAADPVADGYLTVHACGTAPGATSNVNMTRGRAAGALAIAQVDAAGRMCVTSSVATDVAVDRTGEFTDRGGRPITLRPPVRVVDTRMAAAPAAGGRVTVPLPAPAGALAAVVNITATQEGAAGYVTAHPCDQTEPATSNVNYGVDDDISNLAVVRLAGDGTLCLTTSARAHLVADLSGWMV